MVKIIHLIIGECIADELFCKDQFSWQEQLVLVLLVSLVQIILIQRVKNSRVLIVTINRENLKFCQ